jgi:hypothetical protein
MKRFGNLKDVRFDEKELKTDLGHNNFIFIGSSCDMFAENIPNEWIEKTLSYVKTYSNKYFFQSKNPSKILNYEHILPEYSSVCTTIETNRFYEDIMNNSPHPMVRMIAMDLIHRPKYVTIEPIMDFDLDEMIHLIKKCHPMQVNIGADSGNNNLPEPSKEKVLELIEALKEFTIIHNKNNLGRLLD